MARSEAGTCWLESDVSNSQFLYSPDPKEICLTAWRISEIRYSCNYGSVIFGRNVSNVSATDAEKNGF